MNYETRIAITLVSLMTTTAFAANTFTCKALDPTHRSFRLEIASVEKTATLKAMEQDGSVSAEVTAILPLLATTPVGTTVYEGQDNRSGEAVPYLLTATADELSMVLSSYGRAWVCE